MPNTAALKVLKSIGVTFDGKARGVGLGQAPVPVRAWLTGRSQRTKGIIPKVMLQGRKYEAAGRLGTRPAHPGDVARARLAVGAEMAAAAGDDDAANLAATAPAGFVSALVNAQARSEIPRAALDV